jgi:hypothetical protein
LKIWNLLLTRPDKTMGPVEILQLTFWAILWFYRIAAYLVSLIFYCIFYVPFQTEIGYPKYENIFATKPLNEPPTKAQFQSNFTLDQRKKRSEEVKQYSSRKIPGIYNLLIYRLFVNSNFPFGLINTYALQFFVKDWKEVQSR